MGKIKIVCHNCGEERYHFSRGLCYHCYEDYKKDLPTKLSIIAKTKVCQKCKLDIPVETFGPNINYSDSKHNWCKKCVAENTRKYYQSHKEQVSNYVKKWCEKNRARSNTIKKRWLINHKEERREYFRRYIKRKKLNIWVQEIGKEVFKSTNNGECDVCGMDTRKVDLFLFDSKFFCTDCLLDFKETSLIPRVKFVIPKRECLKCHRMHTDMKNEKCVDCRVVERRRFYEKGGFLQEAFA